MTYHGGEDGFSLIEALVALLILGVTTAGLIRAAEAHVDSIRGMERRAAAQWVAENRLVEARLHRHAHERQVALRIDDEPGEVIDPVLVIDPAGGGGAC